MVNYEYFKKLKQMGIYPLPGIIDFLLNYIDLLPVQWRYTRGREFRIFAVKSQFSG